MKEITDVDLEAGLDEEQIQFVKKALGKAKDFKHILLDTQTNDALHLMTEWTRLKLNQRTEQDKQNEKTVQRFRDMIYHAECGRLSDNWIKEGRQILEGSK